MVTIEDLSKGTRIVPFISTRYAYRWYWHESRLPHSNQHDLTLAKLIVYSGVEDKTPWSNSFVWIHFPGFDSTDLEISFEFLKFSKSPSKPRYLPLGSLIREEAADVGHQSNCVRMWRIRCVTQWLARANPAFTSLREMCHSWLLNPKSHWARALTF